VTAFTYRKHDLMCDTVSRHLDHRSAFFQPPEDAVYTTTLSALRKLAAKAGWTHVRSTLGRKYDRDYCPEHKPEPKGDGKPEPKDDGVVIR